MLDAIGEKISEKHLIVFERKAILFLLALGISFFVLVFFRIHYSSIAEWNFLVPEYSGAKTTSKLLWGSPKYIRMDEWHLATPFIMSQAAKNFPVENYAFGPGKVPLLNGLPTRHFSAYFQPHLWGFFFLDIERGFSWFWNYGVISLLASTFLLCMLLTKNNFKLSIFGSLFLFFSSFIQWWFFATTGVLISAFNFVMIASIYLVLSKKPLLILLSALALVLFFVNFALCEVYPPFQVPLGLLLIACIIGYYIQNAKKEIIAHHFTMRLIVSALCASALMAFAFFFYLDLKDTIALTMKTAYPGHRLSTGGEFGIGQLFSGVLWHIL